MGLGDLVEGAVYFVEWDAHDEGSAGMYRYLGGYSPSGAWMFQPVRLSKTGALVRGGDTIYLFPHEIVYIASLSTKSSRPIPRAPESEKRPRMTAPKLHAGRVLLRSVRSSPNTWDVGIVGPAIARAAQFVGFRRIDDRLFATWTNSRTLYAQPVSR